MQFITLTALLFAASTIAAPIAMSTTGNNNYGDDGVPSKTNANGDIVRLSDGASTATGKV